MDVNDAEWSGVKKVVGDDAPVGSDTVDVRMGLEHALAYIIGNARRLDNGNAELESGSLDRRRNKFLAPAAHGIGHGKHKRNIMRLR